jgi:hypothetical protein
MSMKKHEVDPSGTNRTNADEAALELMKQLIALASGVLALSATFIGELAAQTIYLIIVLALAWLSLLVSIFFGLETISAIVKSRLDSNDEWSKGRGKNTARISKHTFTTGIGLFAIFAFVSLISPSKNEVKITLPNAKELRIITADSATTHYQIQKGDTSNAKRH